MKRIEKRDNDDINNQVEDASKKKNEKAMILVMNITQTLRWLLSIIFICIFLLYHRFNEIGSILPTFYLFFCTGLSNAHNTQVHFLFVVVSCLYLNYILCHDHLSLHFFFNSVIQKRVSRMHIKENVSHKRNSIISSFAFSKREIEKEIGKEAGGI